MECTEEIPALFMWKTLSDTIPVILNMESSESNLNRFKNILQSPEFSDMFIYNANCSLTLEQYNNMWKKYKAFTVWLLGRFFYLLSKEKLLRIHDLLIEAQKRILHAIQLTQSHIYNELTVEYIAVLEKLNQYAVGAYEGKITLDAFAPEVPGDLKDLDLSPLFIEVSSKSSCVHMQRLTLKFIDVFVVDNMQTYHINRDVYRILQSLVVMLSNCGLELKFLVLDIFAGILSVKEDFPAQVGGALRKFFSIFEQLTYRILTKEIDINADAFNVVAVKILRDCQRHGLQCHKTCVFILTQVLENNLEVTDDLVNICLQNVNQFPSGHHKLLKLNVKCITKEILDYCNKQPEETALQLNREISDTWFRCHEFVVQKFDKTECDGCCCLKEDMAEVKSLIDTAILVKINVYNATEIYAEFFQETIFFPKFISHVLSHLQLCTHTFDMQILMYIVTYFPITAKISHYRPYYYLLLDGIQAHTVFSGAQYMRWGHDDPVMENNLRLLCIHIQKNHLSHCCDNILRVSCLINAVFIFGNSSLDMAEIESLQLLVCQLTLGKFEDMIPCIIKCLTAIISQSNNVDTVLKNILVPYLGYKYSDSVLKDVSEMMVNLIVMLSSNHKSVINCEYVDDSINIKLLIFDESSDYEKLTHEKFAVKHCSRKMTNLGPTSEMANILKGIFNLTKHADAEIKINAIKTLPVLSRHVELFHHVQMNKWMPLLEDGNEGVRTAFADALHKIIANAQVNTEATNTHRNKLIDAVFTALKKIMKKSLQYKFEIQYTVLATINNMCIINLDSFPLRIMKLLLYFVMMPTSRHTYFAINVFTNLAKRCSTTVAKLYSRYRRDICSVIVELCAINHALAGYNLNTSLEHISYTFGFFGPKHFVSEETRYLLPFFVSLTAKMPPVQELIQEMAVFNDVELSELFTSKYGYIFLHIFLNDDKEDNKNSMEYVEKTTELDRSSLRKRNFMIILNELLLNFHNKRDRVLVALKHLASEDSEDGTISIPEFLQPRFLGVLQYFDLKLITPHFDKRKVLMSLAQIFKFMGPRHISPLRFKIIAMLRTALHLNKDTYLALNCDVWDAFIQSCDIEVLGPQLATIFVSILPLRDTGNEKVNGILRYLVVRNKRELKDYIPDLFFVIGIDDLDYQIRDIIQSHLKTIQEEKTFKEHIQYFLKYLNYETTEVRIHALKYIKDLLEKNRLELDQMVLGYNGIDSTIVELIDILTLGCREQDPALRLACGEVIGELGAIEPSHLPRTCTQNEYCFNFFIHEPAFIVSSLNELIRALQSEKNTQNMDRFSLAIQETLKTYGISPDRTSSNHDLWKLFPEFHQELMIPLLSSKYTMAQGIEVTTVSPIYGSDFASTFKLWLYSWTVNLVSIIKSSKKNILLVCLPSMKQDRKTLMHFLPYILLHALIEGSQNDQRQMYEEFSAILEDKNTQLPDNIINVRPIRAEGFTLFDQATNQETHKYEQYTRIMFVLLDFLDRWLREWLWDKGYSGRENENYKKIKIFLAHFCKLQLAKCNFICGEYPRALMYLEDYMESTKTESNENLSLLAEIYYRLDEPDGVAGVTALRQNEPTLEQRILALEVSGKLFDVAACYERLSLPLDISHIQGLMKCYLDLDNVNTALNFAQGTIERQAEHSHLMLEAQAEPLWRLGRYDDLDELLKKNELKGNNSWGVQIGRSLLAFKNGDREIFKANITTLKMLQVNSLGAASLEEGAYQHGYFYISRLHALNELEQVESMVHELLLRPNDANVCQNVVNKLKMEWDLRLKVVQQSMRITEPILCLRRVAIEQAKNVVRNRVPNSIDLFNMVLGESWLKSAEIATATEVHQQAYTYIIKAEEYSPNTLFLEKAKLHWIREEYEHALTTLKHGLGKIMPDGAVISRTSPTNNLPIEQKKICAEAKLLIASYNDSISNVDTDMNIQHYKEAVEMFREWEKSLVCLAQYYDRLFQNYSEEDKDVKGSDMQIHMINYFGKSLQYGTTYVYQSMPRLLSIWFDYGTRMLEVSSSKIKEERKNNLLKMTKLIDTFLERLPAYIFLTAFSQLVSRICHPQKEVYLELKSIIIKLILKYPQQTLWMMISVIKSSYPLRTKRCSEIFNDSKLKSGPMAKFLNDFTKLAEKLIELCNKDISDNVHIVSVNSLLRMLPRMIAKADFSHIMMPTQMFRKLVLPNPDFSSSQHNPFPNHHVHIVGIDDEMVILPSLQRPRKITLRGSDGKGYIQMLKPKDDLRKDFRLMEFNDIVNQLLSREPESRQRRLNIRLYSVAPLNEECGLIEWVPNLVGLRPVLMTLYKQRGIGMKSKELKEVCCKLTDPMETKRQIFLRKLLPRHPPVLGDWFRKTFPDAQGWLTARTAYTRTTAVISMVGYILGLGDRHGENISLDATSGDTVHVDFNCLFNKGENFEWPERVPFRLTQNMVAAMGPLGVEGLFRKSCACTLRVLRTHTNTLMSIVTPFVYDPLVSWPRNAAAAAGSASSERTNESALDNIREIQCRLKGQVRTKSRSYSIPLSVEGQANNLIREAIDLDNLCQMYIGWGPYL